ncbi:MAG: YlbF family regulator [Gemmatimonadales bacterium]|nr:YlbF family regulator [Gemmatimonadales bacterium]
MIWEKAQELGRMIGQTPEYQALRRAEAGLREDKETVAKLDAIKTLAAKVDQAVSGGEMPDPEMTKSYEQAVRELELSGSGQAYVVARTNFEKVMFKVNELIGKGMDEGATSKIITLG